MVIFQGSGPLESGPTGPGSGYSVMSLLSYATFPVASASVIKFHFLSKASCLFVNVFAVAFRT